MVPAAQSTRRNEQEYYRGDESRFFSCWTFGLSRPLSLSHRPFGLLNDYESGGGNDCLAAVLDNWKESVESPMPYFLRSFL